MSPSAPALLFPQCNWVIYLVPADKSAAITEATSSDWMVVVTGGVDGVLGGNGRDTFIHLFHNKGLANLQQRGHGH